MENNSRQTANELTLAILQRGRNQGIDALNEKQRVVFLVVELDTFAAMEGLFGFYPGVSGEQATEVVDALEQIGAPQSAQLIRHANSLFPGGKPPTDAAELHSVLNSLDDATFQEINEIGRKFLDRPDNHTENLESFIHTNLKALAEKL